MSESKDRRVGWLRDLKPGDKVGRDGCGIGRKDIDVMTVTKISPIGRVTAKSGNYSATFGPEGAQCGLGPWDFHKLVELTPEVRATIARERAVDRCVALCRGARLDEIEALEDGKLLLLREILRECFEVKA